VFGDPLVCVDWRPSALELRTLRVGLPLMLDELVDHGYMADYTLDLHMTDLGDHHIGATRMSRSSDAGVVDRHCRVHDIDNLYVVSSSVFTTGGFVHPTLTIIALALRLGQHLLR
jgi:choline dehydrogenase-like flavoprotein